MASRLRAPERTVAAVAAVAAAAAVGLGLASDAEKLVRAFLQGIPVGSVFALIAVGFVLTYKTSGVFNLAFGAQAYVSAAAYFELHVRRDWPLVPAFVVAVVVLAPLVGVVLEALLFRHLRTAPPVAKLVVSLGLLVALPELFNWLTNFTRESSFGAVGVVPDGRVTYDVLGIYAYTRDELVNMAVLVATVAGLGALFRYSPIGLEMRAVVESARMTELAGIDADRVSALSWALSSLFAGLAGVLLAPRFANLSPQPFFELVIVAIAAAAVGRLTSLPMALAGGLGLGILSTELQSWLRPQSIVAQNLGPSLPFVVLFAVLVLWPGIRRARDVTDPLAGVEPPPPAPAALERGRELTIATRVFGVVFLGAMAVLVFGYLNAFWVSEVTAAAIFAVVFLSITVFTGIGGQISLCQATFAAIGAHTTFQLASRWDVPVLAAALAGVVVAAVVGGLLALPVLRLGGIWLALATLAFALFYDSVMVKFDWVGGSTFQGTRVPRPLLGPVDFASDKSFLVLCIVVLTLVGVLVVLVREGTTGRVLRALRGSEVAAMSIGIDPARARVIAFALSAGIAALGGSLLAMQRQNVNYDANFKPFVGLFWVVIVVTIGSRTVEGAIQAGAGFRIFPELVLKRWLKVSPGLQFVLFGLGAIAYARHPEGQLEFGKRRSLAAWQRRIDRWRARRSPPAALPAVEPEVRA
jgi:branched-chain amino acid transport system permease protein